MSLNLRKKINKNVKKLDYNNGFSIIIKKGSIFGVRNYKDREKTINLSLVSLLSNGRLKDINHKGNTNPFSIAYYSPQDVDIVDDICDL